MKSSIPLRALHAACMLCLLVVPSVSAGSSSGELKVRQGVVFPSTTDVGSTTTETTAPTTTSVDAEATGSIAPSPTNSGVCSLHIDHWHCEGTGTATVNSALEASYSSARGPEPTGRGECEAHEDHWHCDEEESDSVVSESGGEGCVQHGTHFHCPAGVSASCDSVDLGGYNMALHIVALFVLLIASGVGVILPVVFSTMQSRPWLSTTLFVLKHFGTGIIISTAFIHLLMHAFVMFANECLGELQYEAIAPAIAMGSLMVFFLVDFFAGRWMGRARVREHDDENSVDKEPQGAFAEHGHDHAPKAIIAVDAASRQAHWDVQMLEAGVAFHSVMIGVSLGAQAESGFITTFCAVVFHQLFEGLGLGSRIATLSWPKGTHWRKWLMCAIYTTITPIGIAIGIAVHESFNLNGRTALISIGVLDSIAAGILIYAGVCQLLMLEWINGEMLYIKKSKLVLGMTSLFLGLFAMSLIGKWA